MKAIIFALGVVAICASASVRCLAADTANSVDIPRIDAARLFQTGVSYFKEENYPLALAAFQESYAQTPNAAVLYNIAMCYKAQYRYVDAITAFGEYMRLATDDSPEITRVKDELSFLATQVGELTILGVPEGAQVRINGNAITDLSPAIVDPGYCQLIVSADGYKEYEARLSFKAGQKITHTVVLKHKPGHIRVNCSDTNIRIALNHQPAGSCPLDKDLPPGKWMLTAESKGKNPYAKEISINPGEQVALHISLTDAAPAAPKSVHRAGPDNGAPGDKPAIKNRNTVRTMGIISAVSGAAGIAIGTIWAIKAHRDLEHIEEIYDGKEDLDPIHDADIIAEIENFNENVRPGNNAIQRVGFISGGAALTAGIVLLLIDRKKVKEGQQRPKRHLSFQSMGVVVSF